MLILFNKPFNVLSQFTDKQGRRTLAEFISVAQGRASVPHMDVLMPRAQDAQERPASAGRAGAAVPRVRPAGRLDYDSEGLLLLTDDGALQTRIAEPKHKLPKTYWAQVEGVPGTEALEKLRRGVQLNDGRTRPAEVHLIPEPDLWPRDPPIRFRKNIPTAWIELILTEGRNRQVRRMTAAMGYPTLRLVRVAVGPYRLASLMPGEWREADAALIQSAHDLETERGGGGDRRTRRKIPAGRGGGRRPGRAQSARRPPR